MLRKILEKKNMIDNIYGECEDYDNLLLLPEYIHKKLIKKLIGKDDVNIMN